MFCNKDTANTPSNKDTEIKRTIGSLNTHSTIKTYPDLWAYPELWECVRVKIDVVVKVNIDIDPEKFELLKKRKENPDQRISQYSIFGHSPRNGDI